MMNVRKRVAALVVCWLLLAGGAAEVVAQRYRVSVYSPGRYARTRTSMNNRAAARAALRSKRHKRAAHRRHRLTANR